MSDAQVSINGYPIDVAVSEDHQFDSDVTDWPVEQGADITDNARARPITVTVNGLVSDTPIGDLATTRATETAAGSGGNGSRPSNDAFARLLAIRDARQPVSITTSLQTFPNMMLTSLSVPRDAKTGKSLRFRATFKQVRIVTNARTTVRVSVPRAQAKTDQGAKAASPGGAATQTVSFSGGTYTQDQIDSGEAATDTVTKELDQTALPAEPVAGTPEQVFSSEAARDPCDSEFLSNQKQGRGITDNQACQEIVLNHGQPYPWTGGSSNFDPSVNP